MLRKSVHENVQDIPFCHVFRFTVIQYYLSKNWAPYVQVIQIALRINHTRHDWVGQVTLVHVIEAEDVVLAHLVDESEGKDGLASADLTLDCE